MDKIAIYLQAVQGFLKLPFLRQLGLLLGLSASLALGFYLVLWSQNPNYVPLYLSLTPKDMTLVTEALDKAQIGYQYDRQGSGILVPADRVHALRMRLAALGLPKTASNGPDTLEEKSSFTRSQFSEWIRYQRGLESALSQTIASLEAVQEARVHLAIPKESAFLKRKSLSSASVMLGFYPHQSLNSQQVRGIVHLVASSVTGLLPENVTVVDQTGTLLNQQGEGPLGRTLDQFQYTRQLEKDYARRIQDLLTPILGPGRVQVEVNADIDLSAKEETQEVFSPEKQAIRSESLSSERKDKKAIIGGIPGTLSNVPSLLMQATSTSASTNLINGDAEHWRDQSTRNYEVDKSIVYVKHHQGLLKRLSIAVLVDNKLTVDEQGYETHQPLDTIEIEKISQLVKNAIGYQAERGDTVNVVNTAFARIPQTYSSPEGHFFDQPWVWNGLKSILVVMIALLFMLKVLKPGFLALISLRNLEKSSNLKADHSSTSTRVTKGLTLLKWLDPKAILALIRHEHPQVQAIILSHAQSEHAAWVLSQLDEKARLELTRRISQLGEIHPLALQEIELLLEKYLSGPRETSEKGLAT